MTYNVFSGTLNPTHFTSLHFMSGPHFYRAREKLCTAFDYVWRFCAVFRLWPFVTLLLLCTLDRSTTSALTAFFHIERTSGDMWHRFLVGWMPFVFPFNQHCRSTEAIQNTDRNWGKWTTGLVLSSFTTRLLTDGTLLPLWCLPVARYIWHVIKTITPR